MRALSSGGTVMSFATFTGLLGVLLLLEDGLSGDRTGTRGSAAKAGCAS